jgi:flagellar biosynthesis/type III secretory pathway protein FliH
LPVVVDRLRQVSDAEQRGRLLTALTSLMSNQEDLEMVEKLIEVEDELLDTPYLRRIREQAREEGLVEGKEEGLTEGLLKGKEEGLVTGLRQAILETITLRFDPVASIYRQASHRLDQLMDREQLQQALAAAVQAEDMAAFTARLDEIAPG